MATATDTHTHDQSQPSRKVLLGAIAAAPLAASPGSVEDPHLAWERQATELRRRGNALQASSQEDASDEWFGRCWALEDRICETPADTLAGVKVQIRTLIAASKVGQLNDTEIGGLENALATLEQLGGRA